MGNSQGTSSKQKIPKLILIEGMLWKVKRVKSLHHNNKKCHGICDYNRREILVDSNIRGEVLMETMVHEITHALIHDLKIRLNFKNDEKLSDGVGRIMAQLFHLRMKRNDLT